MEKRLATIEVNSKDEVVQVRGTCNIRIKNHYLKIVKDWASGEKLKFVRC